MNIKLLKAQKSSSAAKGSASNRERKQQPLKAFPLTESQKPTSKESTTTKQQPTTKPSNAKETKAVDSRTLTKSKQPTKMSQSVSMNTITSKTTTTTASSRGQQPSKRQTSNSSSRLNVASAQSASNLSSLAADQQAAKEDIVSETPTPANVDQVNVLVDESTTAVSTPEENIAAVEVTSHETQQLDVQEESQQDDDDDDDEANDADVIVDQEVYIVEETVLTNGRQDDTESNIRKRFTFTEILYVHS